MQKKNEPKYCVGCEDSDIKKLNNITDEHILPRQQFQSQPQVATKMEQDTLEETPTRVNGNNSNTNSNMNETTAVLKSKITWAKNELAASNSTTYCIELCQLIKSACEAIASIEKLNL